MEPCGCTEDRDCDFHRGFQEGWDMARAAMLGPIAESIYPAPVLELVR